MNITTNTNAAAAEQLLQSPVGREDNAAATHDNFADPKQKGQGQEEDDNNLLKDNEEEFDYEEDEEEEMDDADDKEDNPDEQQQAEDTPTMHGM